MISNLQAKSIIGGSHPCATDPNNTKCHVFLPSDPSDDGCTTTPDETMTCPAWGC